MLPLVRRRILNGMSKTAIPYLQTCGACGGTNLYNAWPQNVLYCNGCGCRADSKPARNLQPEDKDLDRRKADSKPTQPPPAKPELKEDAPPVDPKKAKATKPS